MMSIDDVFLQGGPPQPKDEGALGGADAGPRMGDREHNMLQHQIDALFTAARTVTHQISDLTIRWQRMDSDIIANNRNLEALSSEVKHQGSTTAAQAEKLNNRIDNLTAVQQDILKAISESADIIKEVRDARTVRQGIAGLLKGTSGVLVAAGSIIAAVIVTVKCASGTCPLLGP